MELHPYAEIPCILISGQARSGTTVLTRALARHPDIHSNHRESNFIRELSVMLGLHTREPRTRQLAVSVAEFNRRFRHAMMHVLFPEESIRSPLPRYFSTFSSLRTDALTHLNRLFPKLHVVNIIRNGVEVVASRMVHRVIGNRSFAEHCDAWAAAQGMAEWGREQDFYHEVRHELLLAPNACERLFRDLFQNLDLPYSPSPLEFVFEGHFNTTRSAEETEQQAQDLSQRRHRWRTWTDEQRVVFESKCGSAMSHLGYDIPW